jgi:hypothetical protein
MAKPERQDTALGDEAFEKVVIFNICARSATRARSRSLRSAVVKP